MHMSAGFFHVIFLASSHLSTLVTGDNLALHKPANQSGVVSKKDGTLNYTANLAVDGRFESQSVAIPDADQVTYTDHAWWWVDLEDTYRIRNITIHNAIGNGNPEFLINFILSVGPDLSILTDCGPEWTKNISKGGTVTIPCNQVGRIVHFGRTENGVETNKVSLREVEVYGTGQYNCVPCPPGTQCDGDNGCSQCAPGKVQSPECEKNCSTGTYGLDCAHQCGQCAQPEDCSVVDGVCSGECQTWWVDRKCDREIVVPNWTDETVMITDSTNSSLTITWQQIQSLDPELYAYYGYSALYKNSTSSSYSEGPHSEHSGQGNISTILTGLLYYQEYDTKIVPYRSNSEERTDGTPYPIISKKTSCGHPEAPRDVRTLSGYSGRESTIWVIWQDITGPDVMHRCDSMTGLRVDYRLSGDEEDWIQENIGIDRTVYEILPQENGEYEVRVGSINNQNFTTSSEIQTLMTAGSSIDVTIIVSVVVATVGIVVIVIGVTFLVLRDRRQRDDRTRVNKHSNLCIIYENEDVVTDLKLNNKESTGSRDTLENNPDEAKYEALDARGQLPDPMFNFYERIRETPSADQIKQYHTQEDTASTST